MTSVTRNVVCLPGTEPFVPTTDTNSPPAATDKPATGPQIGVVGGGASAVCLIDALAQSGLEYVSITIFEPSEQLWRGRPYQPDIDAVRVNLGPECMTVRFGDKDHFLRWLATRAETTEPAESALDYVDPLCGIKFVPRATYGEYLEDSARDALATLAGRGWRVTIIRQRVRSAAPEGHGLVLITDDGRQFPVEHAVMCTGRGVPPDTCGLAGTPGFIADPYPLAGTLAQFGWADDIAVLGSGLTGVDTVLALAAQGHQGRIRLLSRTGVLPLVRQRRMSYELRHFTPESFRDAALRGDRIGLDKVVTTMHAEFDAAGEDLATISAELAAFEHEAPVARLRRHLSEVDSPSYALRILQSAVPATGPDVWTSLQEADKAHLMNRYYRALMSICCPMTPAAAATMVGLIDRGQLTITAGLRNVAATPEGGFTIATAEETLHADIVVNAVNPTERTTSPLAGSLIESLVAHDLAEWHPYGGVHVDRATSRFLLSGRTDPRLYALGDLAGGSLFFTFGMPSLVDRARDIVEDLLHSDQLRPVVVAGRRHAANRLNRLPHKAYQRTSRRNQMTITAPPPAPTEGLNAVRPMTGEEYLDSLRDSREVYIYGERVADVTTHPAFRNSARSIARLYDALHEPAAEGVLRVPSDTGNGGFTHPFFKTARSADDLVAGRDAIVAWQRMVYGWMGRTPDYKAAFLGTLGANAEFYGEYKDNALRWFKDAQERVLYFNHAIVHPPIDRDKPADQTADVCVHVEKETGAGLIVSGAKVVATGSALTNANFIAHYGLPLRDKRFGLVFTVPMDTPGLKLFCRASYEMAAQVMGTPFDYPLSSRMDENDAIMVLDKVLVPWENVFMYDAEAANAFANGSGFVERFTFHGCTRLAVKLDFIAGCALKAVEMTGTSGFRGVQAQIGEILNWRDLFWALSDAMAKSPLPWVGDTVQPNVRFGMAYRTFMGVGYPRIKEILQQTLGSGLIYLNSHAADWKNPEIRPYLDRYVRGSNGIEAIDRVKLLKLLWDAVGTEFGGRHELYERNYGGDHEAVRFQTLWAYRDSGMGAGLTEFVDQCLEEYDLDGWKRPDMFNPGELSIIGRDRPLRRGLTVTPPCFVLDAKGAGQ